MKKQVEKLEADALKLDPKGRARLAEKLLQSLETLSDKENTELWLEEAERRDAELDANPGLAHPADKVLRDGRWTPAGGNPINKAKDGSSISFRKGDGEAQRADQPCHRAPQTDLLFHLPLKIILVIRPPFQYTPVDIWR